jgi:hypothetical protein
VQQGQRSAIEPASVTGEELLLGMSIASKGSLNDRRLFAHSALGDGFGRT